MDPKPGYATTEFWSTILVHLITIVTMFNSNLNSDKLGAIVPIGAFFMSGLAQAYYSHSRGHAKVASLGAAAAVLSAQVDAGLPVDTSADALGDAAQ